MPKVSRNLNHRRNNRKKFGFLRFVVIILSFISLISRIIYCTFATWLTITTFDCIPCANTTSVNASSDLFIAHHSSAIFKTVRALNVESAIKSRAKRSQDVNESNKFIENYSQFFKNDDIYEIKPQKETSVNKSHQKVNSESTEDINPNNSLLTIEEELNSNTSENDTTLGNTSENTTESLISKFFGDEITDPNTNVFPIDSSNDSNSSNETNFEKFTYIPSEDLLVLIKNLSLFNSFDTNSSINSSSNDLVNNTMTITLDENPFNTSDPKRQKKSLLNIQQTNGTSYLTIDVTKTKMNVCSEDCALFLNIELSDPDVRKWATVVITGVLYLYAFVMLCIFMSSCLALVDLLVVSTFIEGAKLFAGFILIIIDSFNGKEIHFDLIDIKFNVNTNGNGWAADFSYSEYLLDIIIFFLSILLCVRVFRCFEKTPKKVSSIEELVDTRGTYRPNHSRNSLEPIYEHN